MNHKNIKYLTQWVLLGVGIVVLIGAFSFFDASSRSNLLLSPQDFITKYENSPNAVMVDVRTPAEFSAGHIAAAVNIDYENPNFSTEVKTLDTSKIYFIYCRSGNRSAHADAIMKSDGIANVYELSGGISGSPELLK